MSEETQKTPEAVFLSPRPYLSWSQIQLFERSPDLYAQKYLYGKEEERTEAMLLGKRLSEALEIREKTGDGALDNLIAFFPYYPEREYEIRVQMDGVEVPLYGVLDGFDPATLRIGENKSGRLWTQEMVDESGQLKMYALLVWLKFKQMPSQIMLHWARTQYNGDGNLEFVGEINSFEADISLNDVLSFTDRVRKAWAGIKGLCQQQLADG